MTKISKFAENEVNAVKVAMLAAPRIVLSDLRDVSAIVCGMLAAQDTHGNSMGLEGPLGVDTKHEKFVWSRIA